MMIKDVVPSISEIPCFYSNDTIDWYKEHYSNACDWSLYELVTVHVIAEDELPSDEYIKNKANKEYTEPNHDFRPTYNKRAKKNQTIYINAINWYKSQILKP